jgi:hypothetical protein
MLPPEDRPEMHLTGLDHTCSTVRARQPSHLVEMLAATPAVRTELIDEIRRQLAEGRYLTEEKLDLAIYRMLKDVLR